jgi:hypothetical protein
MLKNRKRWIISGGVALCVLAGSVALNGDTVEAQRVKRQDSSSAKKAETEAKSETEAEDSSTGEGVGVSRGSVIEKKKQEAAKQNEEDAKARTDKKVDDFFGKIDKDKDGDVSAKEAGKALGAEADDLMKKMDSDKDGKISRKEAEEHFGDETKKEEVKSNTSGGQGRAAVGGVSKKSTRSVPVKGEDADEAEGEKPSTGSGANNKPAESATKKAEKKD